MLRHPLFLRKRYEVSEQAQYRTRPHTASSHQGACRFERLSLIINR